MEDRSIIKPILDALEYFNNSAEEINYFYKIIDKFCAIWFKNPPKKFTYNSIELFLIHDLLGEYIRFEENNKRIALWLLSINRICYNYNIDITPYVEEVAKLEKADEQDFDKSLIEHILNELSNLEKLHEEAGIVDKGESDIVSTYLQWVMVYATIVYPSLENKLDFYEKTTITAMNYMLKEFIKQRSNVKRMAYLIMGIKEACRLYSLQKSNINNNEILSNYSQDEAVLPGRDEDLVKEILDKLKDENKKQKSDDLEFYKITTQQYVENNFEKLIMDLNFYEKKTVSIFNKYVFDYTNKFITLNDSDKLIFLNTLLNINLTNIKIQKPLVKDVLIKSINLFPEGMKKWINAEIKKIKNEDYNKNIIKKTNTDDSLLKFKLVKPYIMLYFIFKLGLDVSP